MRKYTWITFVSIASLFLIGAAPQEKKSHYALNEPSHFLTSEQYLDMSERDREVYTEGLLDGFSGSAMFGASDKTAASVAMCIKGMDIRQLSAIVHKYIKDHPETWQVPASVEGFNALNETCPGTLIPRR